MASKTISTPIILFLVATTIAGCAPQHTVMRESQDYIQTCPAGSTIYQSNGEYRCKFNNRLTGNADRIFQPDFTADEVKGNAKN